MKDSIIENIKELIKNTDNKNVVASNLKVEDMAEGNSIIDISLIISANEPSKIRKLEKDIDDYYS